MKSMYKNRVGTFCLFCLPLFAMYILFGFIPLIKTFVYSLTDWSGYGNEYNWIGLDNFKKIMQDKEFWHALTVNLRLWLVGGVCILGLALICAGLITQSKLRESKYYRIILYMPNIISGVVIAILWKFIFSPNFGLINSGLRAIGLDHLAKNWLGTKDTVLGAIMIVWTWSGFGYYMLLMIAAIEGIPSTYLEAAEIDGANAFQRFVRIVLPLVADMVKTCIVFFTLNAFTGVFALIKFMTDGGPAGYSRDIISYLYQNAFGGSKFGYSAALGVVICILVGSLVAVILRLTQTEDVEY